MHIYLHCLKKVTGLPKKLYAFLLFLSLGTWLVCAQEKQISGYVKDENQAPVVGATVLVEGTNVGAVTDVNGKFTLKAGNEGTLVVSFIGYKTQRIPLNNATEYIVELENDAIHVEDVVVVGFGQQKKESVVGAIVQLKADEIVQTPVANLSNALNGRLPGVVTMQRSGQPGSDDAEIYIRGQATLNGYDSAKPLILVDGVERSFSQIDANEIESMSVLKDASATAVYGVRGANGVILVTTKRGREGAPEVSFSYQYGLQTPTRMPEFLTGTEYAQLYQEAYFNDTRQQHGIGSLYFTENQLKMIRHVERGTASDYEKMVYPNVNWMDEMVKKVSTQMQANVNISGGTKNIRYFISAGYLQQGSVFKDDELQKYVVGVKKYNSNFTLDRYNFRSNLDFYVARNLVLKINLGGRIEKINEPRVTIQQIMQSAYESSPFTPLFYEGVGYPANGGSWNTLAMFLQGGFENSTNSNVESSAILEHDFSYLIKGLKAHVNFSFDSRFNYSKVYDETPPLFDLDRNYDYPVYIQKVAAVPLHSAGSQWWNSNKMYLEVGANYDRTFGDHAVTGLVLYNQQEYRDAAQTPYVYMGLVVRGTYAYRGKYLAEFNLGYNGSENFAKGKRFGLFPAVSVGWVVSQEKFVRDNLPWLDWLKIRASYGEVGNDRIGSDRFLFYSDFNQFTPGFGDFAFGSSYYKAPGVKEGRIGNPNVTWERAKKTNIGLDLTAFRGLLGLTVDLFNEDRDGILISQGSSTPQILGAQLPAVNKGKTNNKGYEIELTHRNRIGQDFSYWFKGNYCFARSKVIFADTPASIAPWQAPEGHPIGTPLLYECIGFWTSQEDIENGLDHSGVAASYGIGDRKYADYNGDGVVNTLDKHYGEGAYSSVPEITYGLNCGFSYKGFDFSMLFNGVAHVSISFWGSAIEEFPGGGSVQRFHQQRWSPFKSAEENADATFPALHLSQTLRSINSQGSYGKYGRLVSGDYLRLKNVELGYTLPERWSRKIGISSIRVYANGNNLALLYDKTKIRDPESGSNNGQFYPQMRVFNLGINLKF